MVVGRAGDGRRLVAEQSQPVLDVVVQRVARAVLRVAAQPLQLGRCLKDWFHRGRMRTFRNAEIDV